MQEFSILGFMHSREFGGGIEQSLELDLVGSREPELGVDDMAGADVSLDGSFPASHGPSETGVYGAEPKFASVLILREIESV
jgi:hypothetical protein